MKKLLLILFGFAVLALAWWAVLPLFTDKVVNEELPFDTSPIVPAETLNADITVEDAPFEVIVDENTKEIETPEITTEASALRTGSFTGVDDFHQAKGTATIYDYSGELFLELSDFEVTNGPDLFVNLSQHPNPRSKGELGDDTLQLARLKGNIGNQIYRIPEGTDISSFQSAVIYCKAFRVIFGTAHLK